MSFHKKQSYGSAMYYLNGRTLTMRRYLNKFYPIYDWEVITHFFLENPIQTKMILDDFTKGNDAKQDIVLNIIMSGKSKIIYICGGRGQGKSVLAYWIAEQIHNRAKWIPIYCVGVDINKVFPNWIRYADNITDVPNGSFIILDEASIRYNAREYQKDANIVLGKMLAIARHKDLSVVFITQHVALMDINITRLRDMIIWKKSNSYSYSEKGSKNTREDRFFSKVRMNMSPRNKNETLFEYPAEKRFIHFLHDVPTFWTEEMSTSFKDYKFEQKEVQVKNKSNNKLKGINKDVY